MSRIMATSRPSNLTQEPCNIDPAVMYDFDVSSINEISGCGTCFISANRKTAYVAE